MKSHHHLPMAANMETDIIPKAKDELKRLEQRASNCSAGVFSAGNRAPLLPNRFSRPASAAMGHQPDLMNVQLAYAAGFIDGEGCVSAVEQIHPNRRNPSVRIRVDISQNDLDQLEFVQRILGCGGCLNPVKLQPNQRRQCYVLSYDGRSAIEVLIKIRPYLRRKRNEADECIWLFVAGNLSRMPGPRGLDPELVTLRRASVLRIKGMK